MTVRLQLRDATRAAHERTDAAFSSLDIAGRDDYGLFLSSHFLAYRTLAPVFAGRLPSRLCPPDMSESLSDDIGHLGFMQPTATVSFSGDALGAAYVVAGSHFGQRVLSRRHAGSSDARVRSACRYLGSVALRGYWPTLRDEIERSDAPARFEQLRAGAEATFALFADCLSLARQEGMHHEFA